MRTAVAISSKDGIRIVTVVGDIDLTNAKEIGVQIAAATTDGEPLILSLERCEYCDSSGLAMLIDIERKVGDGLVVVIPPASPFLRIFTITGLDRVLRITGSEAEALGMV